MPTNHKEIWDDFCTKLDVFNHSVPLFQTDADLRVDVKNIGTANRRVLCRSKAMEKLVIEQVALLLEDARVKENRYDGLIYMMHYLDGELIIPLYIGKTETKGRKNPLSANIKNIAKNKNKFARWGDNRQYHIGDLSDVVLGERTTPKYQNWASTLFETSPSKSPVLNRQTYFWCMAWSHQNVGIWEAFGETRLSFLEYLMIGVASSAFGDLLLNSEGQNR